jgi:Mg-chelatase subunit ChlD
MYRGFPWKEMCSLYDPRQRPWYVAGSSGTKNLVLILDISGSMNAPSGIVSRLQLAKDAVTQVVDGLTNSDWVGFISFSSGATAY